jgi:hypothetical protein
MKENRLPVDNFRRNKMAVKVCVWLGDKTKLDCLGFYLICFCEMANEIISP